MALAAAMQRGGQSNGPTLTSVPAHTQVPPQLDSAGADLWVRAPTQSYKGGADGSSHSRNSHSSSTCSPAAGGSSNSSAAASIASTPSSDASASHVYTHPRVMVSVGATKPRVSPHRYHTTGEAGVVEHTYIASNGAHVPFRHATANLAVAQAEAGGGHTSQHPHMHPHQPQQQQQLEQAPLHQGQAPSSHSHSQQHLPLQQQAKADTQPPHVTQSLRHHHPPNATEPVSVAPHPPASRPSEPSSQQHHHQQHTKQGAAEQLRKHSTGGGASDIVRTQYVPLDEDSDSSDLEMEVHLMRKYGIKS